MEAKQLNQYEIENAVSVFYSSEHADRAQVHKWLTDAQKCPQAWSFVWELLDPAKTTEIQFFAATTLHTKLQRFWQEVPPPNYDELKTRIIQAIVTSFNGPKIVLNRLCISLAAFILQQKGVGLLETVNQLSTSQNVSLVIEVLSVIPEEFNNMTMAASDRAIVRVNLQHLTTQVLELVMKHLQNNLEGKEVPNDLWLYQNGIWQGACQCASAWIQLGGVNPIQCLPVVSASLQVLHTVYRGQCNSNESARSELGRVELETCEAALNAAAAALTQPDAARYPATCCQLMRLLIDAVEPILRVEDVLHSANEDLVVALYSTLVAAGEYHGRWIAVAVSDDDASLSSLGTSEQIDKSQSLNCAKDLLKLLLCCSGAAGVYPTQESHSKLAFSFWFTLQDEGLWNSRSGGFCAIKQALKIWYEQLVVILLRKSTITSQHSEFTAEDEDLNRCYRQDISDTLVYCHTVLGNPLVVQLENLMLNLVGNCLSDGGCALEAVLHAFLALAEFVYTSAAPSLFTLMKVLTELPYDKLHQQVLLTVLGCFIAYADWLGKSENSGVEDIVGRALTIIWATIDNKEMTSLGVLALKAICKECGKYLQPHAHQLLQAFQSGQGKWPQMTACQIMRAAGCTAASLTPSEAAPYLSNLVTPLVQKLEVTNMNIDLSAKQLTVCAHTLQQLSALLLSLLETEVKHAYAPLTLLLPTFPSVAKHDILTEPLFKLIKLVITRLQEECVPLIPDLIRVTNISLEVNPHPSNIEVCKLMAMMIPGVGGEAFLAGISAVLRVSGETISQGGNLSDHAQLIDTFYSALSTIINKKPQHLVYFESQMEHVIQLGLISISLPEQGPSKAVCNFFGNLARVLPDRVLPHGPVLVHRIVHCIGKLVSRNYIDPFADLLWKLGRVNWVNFSNSDANPVQSPAHLSAWLKDALQEPGFPTELASVQVKDKFIKAVVKHFGHKRRMMEVVREFALASRGLLGAYGDMTQPVDGSYITYATQNH